MTSSSIGNRLVEVSQRAPQVARVATATIAILSSMGLLSIPLGDYDDAILLMGVRLVRAGHLPYLDFYSHYGPFGYTVLGPLLGLTDSPVLALRVGQILLLAALAVAAHLLLKRTESAAAPWGSQVVVPLIVLGLSTLAALPSFFGFGFGLLSLLLLIAARYSRSSPGGHFLAVLGGAALAVATLTRPAFGAYIGGAVALTGAMVVRFRPSSRERGITLLVFFFLGALFCGLLLWVSFYRAIPLRVAFDATVRTPTFILAGGGRYQDPDFLRRGLLDAIVGGAAVTGANLVWSFALPTRRARFLALSFLALCALIPFLIRLALPRRPLSWLGLVLLPLPFLVAFVERKTLRESPDLAAAALMGLTAAVFGHYAWWRPDAAHLLPSIGLAAFGVTLVWKRFRAPARFAIVVLFVLAYRMASRDWGPPVLPISRLRQADIVQIEDGRNVPRKIRWGCERVSHDIAGAVALADKSADPTSRFVAVASSHVATQANPVLLFLMSDRLPYTRWFQYDPGLQSSPSIQRELQHELLASRSETAVVWPVQRFLVDRRRPSFKALQARSDFDVFFDRLYPDTIGRFGEYEVRRRARQSFEVKD
jgi:hypothetical protein